MLIDILAYVNVLCTGVSAGEEFVIRYGVRGPVARLDDVPHIQLRQALIRTLHILAPTVFGLDVLSGMAAALLGGSGTEFQRRQARVSGRHHRERPIQAQSSRCSARAASSASAGGMEQKRPA